MSHAITAACITFLEELGKWAVLRGPEPESLVRGMKLEGAALSAQKGWRVEVELVSLL